MRFGCWISKATRAHMPKRPRANTHINKYINKHKYINIHKYVTIFALPRQKWLRKRASMLRCTYTACLGLLYLISNNVQIIMYKTRKLTYCFCMDLKLGPSFWAKNKIVLRSWEYLGPKQSHHQIYIAYSLLNGIMVTKQRVRLAHRARIS
jgi:hypothetical protein